MNIEKILEIIIEYQKELENKIDYSITDREYTRSAIKHQAAVELYCRFIRRWNENDK